MKSKKIWIITGVFLIVMLGFFLRVYDINNIPPGIYPDEAVNGTDAARANATGKYLWFYPDNQGREGLLMNFIAICFKVFGISIPGLKFPSIILGTLAVLGTYFLARELFNRRIGLISSFFMAVSFWPINFSRIAFRAIFLPAILVFSFYFLFLGLRTKKWYFYAIGGLIFGIGMHTYIAWRIAPLILLLLLVFIILSRTNFLKENWKYILVFLAGSLITAAPMFWTYYAHPEYLESRSASISILSPEMNQGDLIGTFIKTFSLSLVKYNFWGDPNWRHNYPPYPLLDPLTGIAFLFGIIFSIACFFKLLYQRVRQKIKNTQLENYALLILWFFIMLVPEFMTNEGLPHALRAIGTQPAVFILSALSFNYAWEKANKNNPIYQKMVIAIAVFMLFIIGTFNISKYFLFWGTNPKTAQSFEQNITELAFFAQSMPNNAEVYALLGNMQRIPPRLFNWGNPNFHDLHASEIDKINPRDPNNLVILFSDYSKDEIISAAQKRFPNLIFYTVRNQADMEFYILK